MKRVITASTGEGWDESDLSEITELLDTAYKLSYELERCVRGAYTDCTTYKDLAEYIINLGEEFQMRGQDLYELSDDLDNEGNV